MDFIEAWFGLSPDGGDGSTELLWLAAVGVGAVGLVLRRRILSWFVARGPLR